MYLTAGYQKGLPQSVWEILYGKGILNFHWPYIGKKDLAVMFHKRGPITGLWKWLWEWLFGVGTAGKLRHLQGVSRWCYTSKKPQKMKKERLRILTPYIWGAIGRLKPLDPRWEKQNGDSPSCCKAIQVATATTLERTTTESSRRNPTHCRKSRVPGLCAP